jgi:ATP-binding cassette subfamily F protein 3
LLKAAEKLEKDLAQWQQEKQQIDGQLADPAFYANPDAEKLRALTMRQQELTAIIDAEEQRWLEVHAALETIGEA